MTQTTKKEDEIIARLLEEMAASLHLCGGGFWEPMVNQLKRRAQILRGKIND